MGVTECWAGLFSQQGYGKVCVPWAKLVLSPGSVSGVGQILGDLYSFSEPDCLERIAHRKKMSFWEVGVPLKTPVQATPG